MKQGKSNNSKGVRELKGKVVSGKFGAGSKSQHDAVYLECDEGSFVLRRIGANPFQDSGLHKYIGKKVMVKGIVEQYVLMVQEINVI